MYSAMHPDSPCSHRLGKSTSSASELVSGSAHVDQALENPGGVLVVACHFFSDLANRL